jgi:hypothetical protein
MKTVCRLFRATILGVALAATVEKLHAAESSPEVLAAWTGSSNRVHTVELGDRLFVAVTNLTAFVEGLRKEGKNPRLTMVPYLKGVPLNGIYPESIDTNRNEVRFHLRREQKSREAWAALLGAPDQFQREVAVSVGTEAGGVLPTKLEDGMALKLVVIREGWLWFVIALCTALLLWFFIKARTTAMLRDPGLDPGNGNLRPYSLAKCQMAWWFFLTVVSFLFIFAVTGAYDSIPGSVFVLIGISAATGLGVIVQNSGKDDPWTTRKKQEKERDEIIQTEDIQRTPEQKARLVILLKELARPLAAPPASEGFGRDILTDAQGVSFHRFQMAVWTGVLGLIFLIEVWRSLAMPEFNGTLLALMGISSGTYLGFMIPERHSATQQSQTANPQPNKP